jgi:tRNA dimethylallyltransferase
MTNKAVIIMGPTAVGKSAVALDTAEKLGGEIVSADSMQIYRGLDIGTAKPTREARARVPHHMIDVADPKKAYSVAKYRKAAGKAIEDILSRGRLPVIVGGTGLYIHSLLYDMDFGRTKGNESARREYERLAGERGAEYIYGLLTERDPEAAAQIHPNNTKRVIRALERISVEVIREQLDASPDEKMEMIYDGNGITEITERYEQEDQKDDAGQGGYRPFGFDLRKGTLIDPVLILLTRERAELVDRIDMRVDDMILDGLVKEVEGLVAQGLTLKQISMLGIGYKEMLGYLYRDYGFDEMAELIKIHTRRYAKRQMTWFKRYEDAITIDLSATGEAEATDRIVALSTA